MVPLRFPDQSTTEQPPSNPSWNIRSGVPKHCENSEVLPSGSVAVAVNTLCPAGTVKGDELNVALPLAFVTTAFIAPRKWRPSPYPDAWQPTPEKNSMRNDLLAVLFSVPETFTVPDETGAAVDG